jgi:lipoprotein-anchoring transpeptidase ErfK/SrfK
MKKTRTRDLIVLVVGLALVLGAALGGYAVVRARAAGGDARQALAPVDLPASVSASATPAPEYQRWTVGKAVGPVVVRVRPAPGAPVKATLGKVNQNGYPTLMLLDGIREVHGVTWYKVWVAMRPNGSRGWVREGQLAFYTTSARIVIDLSRRELTVYRRGEFRGTFPVAVGRPGLETPTGFFFVNQKLKPSSPGGSFGALAIGISAFQPKLSGWAQGGPVAIHGTNQDELIGKAVSHGCVRMHDKDVRAVDRLVPAGSPVVIME